jgi:hypothetical protein
VGMAKLWNTYSIILQLETKYIFRQI